AALSVGRSRMSATIMGLRATNEQGETEQRGRRARARASEPGSELPPSCSSPELSSALATILLIGNGNEAALPVLCSGSTTADHWWACLCTVPPMPLNNPGRFALPGRGGRMWRVALRDLQWRRRRFVIAVLATSLVFGMTLLMTGATATLYHEGRRIVAALGADAWLVADGASGPFTTSTPTPAAAADQAAAPPGAARAAP